MWRILLAFLIGIVAGGMVGMVAGGLVEAYCDTRYLINNGICPVCKRRTRVRKPEDVKGSL
jgi:hypothetical protein